MTRVLFRRTPEGDILAVFPELPSDIAGHFMACYQHIGQHGGCSPEWYRTTTPARPDEYAALAAELRAIGYALVIGQRIPARAYRRRRGDRP